MVYYLLRNKMRIKIIYYLALIIVLNVYTYAQDAKKGNDSSFVFAKGSPEWVVNESNKAIKMMDFEKFVKFMIPSELVKFKAQFEASLSNISQETFEEEIKDLMPGINSFDELKRLPTEKFLAKFLSALFNLKPVLKILFENGEYKTLGHVMENDTTVHVVYRLTINYEGNSVSKIDVSTLINHNGEWKLLLKDDLAGESKLISSLESNPTVKKSKEINNNSLLTPRNAMIADLVTIANIAQVYYRKPASLGGGGNSFIGFTIPETISSTRNGEYSCEVFPESVTIVGTGKQIGNDGTNKMKITVVVFKDKIDKSIITN